MAFLEADNPATTRSLMKLPLFQDILSVYFHFFSTQLQSPRYYISQCHGYRWAAGTVKWERFAGPPAADASPISHPKPKSLPPK
jgi:hypothetical protein